MNERPILFSAPMIRALLAGTKTQTRRAVKRPERFVGGLRNCAHCCPYGQPGDRLWVRETWGYFDPDGTGEDYDKDRNDDGKSGPCKVYAPELMQEGHALRNYWRRRIAYAADWKDGKYGHGLDGPSRWRPSIHMPHWASRILLEVTEVRVERLQDISETDALAEGIHLQPCGWFSVPGLNGSGTTARAAYALLWNTINGEGSWGANPWVWCVSFSSPALGLGAKLV